MLGIILLINTLGSSSSFSLTIYLRDPGNFPIERGP